MSLSQEQKGKVPQEFLQFWLDADDNSLPLDLILEANVPVPVFNPLTKTFSLIDKQIAQKCIQVLSVYFLENKISNVRYIASSSAFVLPRMTAPQVRKLLDLPEVKEIRTNRDLK